MVAQARAELPNECCGLLAGKIIAGAPAQGVVAKRYPLINQAASSTTASEGWGMLDPRTEYLAAGRSMLDAQKDMRRLETRELAVYHSHPTSAPIPSKKDIERNIYGMMAMHLIISLQAGEVHMRAWWLGDQDFTEAEWDWV